MGRKGFGDSLNWEGNVPAKRGKKRGAKSIQSLIYSVVFVYGDIDEPLERETIRDLELVGGWDAEEVAAYLKTRWDESSRAHGATPYGPELRFSLNATASAQHVISTGRRRDGRIVPHDPGRLEILPGLWVWAQSHP